MTAPHDRTPTNGPALTLTALIPDLHHYHGRGGRAFPLWANAAATEFNIRPSVLIRIEEAYGREINPEEVFAYIGAVAANPAYTARFAADLMQPGLHIPLTGDPALFAEAVRLGREVIWLHTFGEALAQGGPRIPAEGAIPGDPEHMPDTISYDGGNRRLWIGGGYVENVPPTVWAYEVSGKHVLTQWFSYRRRNRERPQIGDRRPPSPLGDVQPDRWLAEYTTELINVLHVLGRLVLLESAQAALLDRLCDGPTLDQEALRAE